MAQGLPPFPNEASVQLDEPGVVALTAVLSPETLPAASRASIS